jgi:hypothetical protein
VSIVPPLLTVSHCTYIFAGAVDSHVASGSYKKEFSYHAVKRAFKIAIKVVRLQD